MKRFQIETFSLEHSQYLIGKSDVESISTQCVIRMVHIAEDRNRPMSDEVTKNAVDENIKQKASKDLAKPKDSQIEEGTLLLMEDMLEERNTKTRRVENKPIPASEDRRKSNRREADSDGRA